MDSIGKAILGVMGVMGFVLTISPVLRRRAIDGFTGGDRNFSGSRALALWIIGVVLLLLTYFIYTHEQPQATTQNTVPIGTVFFF